MRKYQVLFVLWLFQVVNYIDRTTLSFAGPAIIKALHLGPKDFGIILSSFALGYFISQIPGGLLSDRFGARIVLIVAPLFWALLTGWVGLVSTLASFIVLRFCFGIAEGASNPAVFKVIGDIFHPRERVRASAIWATSIALAPALAGPIIALLLSAYGWRSLFLILAVPGVVMAGINAVAIPRSEAQPAPADGTRSEERGAAVKSLRASLATPAIWVALGAYFAFQVAFFAYLGWMPSYLAAARGIDLRQIGLLGGVPFVFGTLGLVVIGYLASGPLYTYRLYVTAAAHGLAAVFLGLAFTASSLPLSLTGLSGAAFFLYGGFSIYGAIVIDLAPIKARGLYSSVLSSAGQLGGIVAPVVIGLLVAASHNYASAFQFMMGSLALASMGVLALHFVVHKRPLNLA